MDFYDGNIFAGQFSNDALSGFGRRIDSNGYVSMGWCANNLDLHGFGKKIYSDGNTLEGLFEEGDYEPQPKEDITQYSLSALIAKRIPWEDYIIYNTKNI